MPSKAPQSIYQLKITLTRITPRSVVEGTKYYSPLHQAFTDCSRDATMLVMRPEKKKAEVETVAEQQTAHARDTDLERGLW